MEEQICLWQLNQERSTNAIVFKKKLFKNWYLWMLQMSRSLLSGLPGQI